MLYIFHSQIKKKKLQLSIPRKVINPEIVKSLPVQGLALLTGVGVLPSQPSATALKMELAKNHQTEKPKTKVAITKYEHLQS